MKAAIASFVAGLVFALGLGISGMTRPSAITGFLDVGGSWDASLAFVMIGAVAIYAALHPLVVRRRAPLLDTRFHLPSRTDLDLRLGLGAALFGIGWGLGGYCPGPGIVVAATGALPAIVFVGSMIVGMKMEQVLGRRGGVSTFLERGRARSE